MGYLYYMETTRLIVVFGLPGTGKTYFSQHLAERLGVEHFNTDVIRNRMGKQGQYDEETKQLVYEALFAQIRDSLLRHHTIVVDGTFYKRKYRDRMKAIAEDMKCPIHFFEVLADEPLALERVGQERAYSEADASVYKLIKDQFEPMGTDHFYIHSERDNIDAMVRQAIDYLVNHA